jgi:hypothetical protein
MAIVTRASAILAGTARASRRASWTLHGGIVGSKDRLTGGPAVVAATVDSVLAWVSRIALKQANRRDEKRCGLHEKRALQLVMLQL